MCGERLRTLCAHKRTQGSQCWRRTARRSPQACREIGLDGGLSSTRAMLYARLRVHKRRADVPLCVRNVSAHFAHTNTRKADDAVERQMGGFLFSILLFLKTTLLIFVRVQAWWRACVRACVRVCVCVCVCVCVRDDGVITHTHTHTRKHTRTHGADHRPKFKFQTPTQAPHVRSKVIMRVSAQSS